MNPLCQIQLEFSFKTIMMLLSIDAVHTAGIISRCGLAHVLKVNLFIDVKTAGHSG